MRTLILGGTIVSDNRAARGSIVVDNSFISEIYEGTEKPCVVCDYVVDAAGCFVIPGVIDSHVHFREPGLTHKADIGSESAAAACGGVTTFFDMPNTVPQTTTGAALDDKIAVASRTSRINYAFFLGVTNDNADEIAAIDVHKVPGVKLFMGSSTGGMLVDKEQSLRRVFSTSTLPIVAHCEDTAIINTNAKTAVEQCGGELPIEMHSLIRSSEACISSSSLAVGLAKEYSSRLHVAHVSTARELAFFGKDANITAEATLAHLLFCDIDYADKGALIKCNPAVKTKADREELRRALADGRITTVATDHAPHLLSEKQGGCLSAASGMPLVQFSLVAMLGLVDQGVISIERLVELMCHNPAKLFEVRRRGFLRKGYKADITIVKPCQPWVLTRDAVLSRCGWSPLEGMTFGWRVVHTLCNGQHIVDNGNLLPGAKGEQIEFR